MTEEDDDWGSPSHKTSKKHNDLEPKKEEVVPHIENVERYVKGLNESTTMWCSQMNRSEEEMKKMAITLDALLAKIDTIKITTIDDVHSSSQRVIKDTEELMRTRIETISSSVSALTSRASNSIDELDKKTVACTTRLADIVAYFDACTSKIDSVIDKTKDLTSQYKQAIRQRRSVDQQQQQQPDTGNRRFRAGCCFRCTLLFVFILSFVFFIIAPIIEAARRALIKRGH